MGKAETPKGGNSRRRILYEAFKLFATMPYDRVSFAVMEKEIGISRGSMVYYFKNKEGLFGEIVKTLILDLSSVMSVPEAYTMSLRSFYNYFIETLTREKDKMTQMGVLNMNEAYLRIEISALTYVENFKTYGSQWYDEERKVWEGVIRNGISIGEIKPDIDPELFGRIFEDCFLGHSFRGVFSDTGYDIDSLKKEFDQIYNLLKK